MPRALIAFCLLMATSGCRGRAAEDGLDRVKRTGVLRWGADLQGGEPYVFEDPARPGVNVGFEVEIADALARELGVRAELVQNDWSTLVPSLERGTFDIAMNGLEVTAARQRRIGLTRPYYVFAEELVVREGDARARGPRRAARPARGHARQLARLGHARTGGRRARAVRRGRGAVHRSRQPAAPTRCCSTTSSPLATATSPACVSPAQVGHGTYAIGARKEDTRLWRAIDEALARMIASGELRRSSRAGSCGPRHRSRARAASRPRTRRGRARPAFSLSPHQLALFLQRAGITLLISTAAMGLAMLLGLLLALARMPSPFGLAPRRRLRRHAYVELFRGTPVLLQLYVLYYGLADVLALDALPAAVLGLGLNYAAYEAEIYRAGIAGRAARRDRGRARARHVGPARAAARGPAAGVPHRAARR